MSTQTTVSRPAPFVEDIGKDLAKQAVAMTGVPVVSTGITGISRQPGETAEGFKARQDAARAFTTRQESLAGLAPQVAGQDALQRQAQTLAQQGVGSFQPFLASAQTLTGAGGGTGAGSISQFMSPYQSQVIDASLKEFDRNAQIQQKQIADRAIASGAFGGGREGVEQAEFMKNTGMNRAQLQANLLNQGFNQAQAARQQQFANQMGLASALPSLQAGDISTLGSLGALNQAQQQAQLDAQREATRMATYQPQEQLQQYGNLVTGIMGGMQGSGTVTQPQPPAPGFLQTALGAAATGAGIYGAFRR
jgi:hypothetical protein